MGGDDTLTGGAGADVFLYETGDGADVITDFAAGAGPDELHLFGTGVTSLSGLLGSAASATSDGTRIALGAWDSVLLAGVAAADLADGDIRFDPPAIAGSGGRERSVAAALPAGRRRDFLNHPRPVSDPTGPGGEVAGVSSVRAQRTGAA